MADFGDIAISMFEERTVTLPVHEWVQVLRAMHAGDGGQQSAVFAAIASQVSDRKATRSRLVLNIDGSHKIESTDEIDGKAC